jgi:hypothetical protein
MSQVNPTNYLSSPQTTLFPSEQTTTAKPSEVFANKTSVALVVTLIGLLLAVAAILLVWKFRKPHFIQKLDEEALQCRENDGVEAGLGKSDVVDDKSGSAVGSTNVSTPAKEVEEPESLEKKEVRKPSQQRSKSSHSQDSGQVGSRLNHLSSERCEVELCTTRPFLQSRTSETPVVVPCRTEERKSRVRQRNSTDRVSQTRTQSTPSMSSMRPVHSEEMQRSLSQQSVDVRKRSSN